MGETVDNLLNIPFLSRSRQDKCRIIADGKPRPPLNMAAVVMINDTGKPEVQTRHFSLSMYDEVPWLTGCEKRESVFCWPCLLFASPSPWSINGISDFGFVIEGMHEHEESAHHIKATLQLQDMVELNVPSSSENDKQRSETVKRNRAILKRLTDVVCNLFTKEQPYYKRKNGCQISPGSCVKNLQFLRTYDILNCHYIEDAIDLINMTPDIINDVVDTISELIKLDIKKEIRSSAYVSVILSDHTEVSTMPQISTVLRYVKDSKIFERFVGFSSLGNVRYSAVVCQHLTDLVTQFEFSDKFIAVSLDGGILSVSELSEFTEYIRSVHPYATFVPWHSHGLNYVLQQSLSNINDCSLFFKTINNLKIYLQKKSRRFKALEAFMSANNPSVGKSKWFTRSQMINVLNSHRKYFILFFESVVQNSHKWKADEIAKALGFQKVLEDFKTVFLLHVFSRLFPLTSTLNKILNGKSPENIFDCEAVSQLINVLAQERDSAFEEVWAKAEFETCVEVLRLQPKRIKTDPDNPEVLRYRELHTLIFDHVIREIDIRFSDVKRLKFCRLLKLNQCVDFTSDMLHHLVTLYGHDFDEELVKNEIIVLRTNSTAFKEKSTYDMLELFSHSTLKNTFKSVHKITHFLFALPVKPPSADADTSKFQDIIDWSYIPSETGHVSGDVGIPCVELELLQDLKKSNSFHDDVFANFRKGAKTFDLLQK